MKCPGCGRQFGPAAVDQFAQCPVCGVTWAPASSAETPAPSAFGLQAQAVTTQAASVPESPSAAPDPTPYGSSGSTTSSAADPWAASSAGAAVTTLGPAVPRAAGGVLRAAPAKGATWLRSAKVVGTIVAMVGGSFVAGGLVGAGAAAVTGGDARAGVAAAASGDDSTGAAAKGTAPPTTTATTTAPAPAASGPRSPEDAEADLRGALTVEKVFYTDELRFTDDLAALTPIAEGEGFTLGAGVAVTDGRVVNIAVANDGQLLCLTATSTEGTIVLANLIGEQDQEVRYGPGPIDRCDTATFRSLPGEI